jgi:hypothetical protein
MPQRKGNSPSYNINAFETYSVLPAKLVSAQSKRNIAELTDVELEEGCRLGMDSHADMSCVGAHAHILEEFEGQVCNVLPFNDSYAPLTNIKTVNAAFAYDTDNGRTYIIHINQCLNFTKSMKHSLLCPNQARMNNVVIDDCPIALDPSNRSTHSIYFPQMDIRLPLLSKFPISFLPVRRPTEEELEFCQILELTSNTTWDTTLYKDLDIKGMSTLSEYNLIKDDLSSVLSRHVNIDAITHSRSRQLNPSDLASLWNIGIEPAKYTLHSTTQDYIRYKSGKLSRRVKTLAHQNRYNQLSGYLGKFCSDTFKSNVVSTRGNKTVQLFCNRGNYVKCYPMKSKGHAHHALDRLLHEVGIPSEMFTDGAKELTLSDWGTTCRKHKIPQATTEPHSPWQNPAELSGGIIKRQVRKLMKQTATPVRLWDYCWEYAAALRSLTATNNIYLDKRTPFELVHGYTPDISEYTTFKWYDWIWFHEPTNPDKQEIGRWLGPAHNVGQGLAYYVLSNTGKVRMRSTVSAITDNEKDNTETHRMMEHYTKSMESTIGNFSNSTQSNYTDCDDDPYESMFENDHLDDEDVEPQETDEYGNIVLRPELDNMDSEAPIMEEHDTMIGARIPLPHNNGDMQEAQVKNRKRNHDGTLVGTQNDNPLLDTRVYEVEFPDGSYAEYASNVLAENLYSQIDDDARSYSILSNIIDHKCDESIAISDKHGTYISNNGSTKRRITTKGWSLQVEWKDGTTSWIPLKIIKESNPIETAEYAISRNIHKQPAFAWWVSHTIHKRNRIIKQVTHRTVRKNIKYGVQVPSSVEEALRFDKENGNDLWAKSIDKEMKNVIIAFKLLDEGDKPPVGSKLIPYHLIFDVRFDMTRKSRLVAGGHRHKDVPSYATFSSVVSRDSVRIIMMLAALNDLKVKSTDIGNAYLNAPNKERVHVKCGRELFGPESEGKIAVIVRALYGLKSAGNAWRHYFAAYIRDELKFEPTTADPDVYRKPLVKTDGTKYYAYLIIYVDDVLCCHTNPDIVMNKLSQDFRLKNGIEDPTMYLGTDMKQWSYTGNDGTNHSCWAMGSENYIKEALKTCDKLMHDHQLQFTSTKRHGRKTPFSCHTYRPELDDTNYCDTTLLTVFQNLIGILRWICELGRVDILYEVSVLSQYLAQPRIGHLNQCLNIFYYLKYHNRSWTVMDPTRFDVNWNPRGNNDIPPQERATVMKELYTDASELIPHNIPESRGKEVDINVFVDADHAGNKITRRSHTGVIITVNMAPVIWYSKRQNTVETSTFGSEFIALRIAVELTEALRYKLRMFGVPLSGPARIYCDNESVVNSSTIPESRLKKKHCSIAYHRIREAVAAGTILIYYEKTDSNLADLLTKSLTANKREPLIHGILS